MNELIKITEKDGQQLVSARELYVGLKYDTTQGNFSHWIEKQLENVDAIKNVDYTCLVFKNETNNGDATDYILTTKIAKEICMVVGAMPRTNKETKALSKKYREYFIKCEEKLKTIVQPTPSYMIEDPIERAKVWITEQEELQAEQEKVKQLGEENKANKPKVIFADAVATSQTSILVGELAKILKQNDIEIGEKRLFKWLRNNGYLIKRNGSDYNMPTQKSVDLGVIEIKERAINNPDGSVRVTKTPKVTGKGQQYFINKFLNNKEEQ